MSLMYVTPQEILDFWFSKEVKRHWFEYSEFLDTKVRVMYERIFRDAVNCELSDWRDTIQGRLAEIIILDQFSRLIFRGRPHAYTQDRMALLLAQEAVRYRTFPFLEAKQRQFILMPFLHSENRNIHTVARGLFQRFGTPKSVRLEERHKAVIDRFGRYPHRNAILNRQSTPEELAFLKANPSGFELDDEDDDE
ncbi:DUF924 family protein [Neisseria elongata]|uniref:DUF924 family protein n=1 Tax=Neisseria elongata TaxID=495 RepID=UPI003614E8A4